MHCRKVLYVLRVTETINLFNVMLKYFVLVDRISVLPSLTGVLPHANKLPWILFMRSKNQWFYGIWSDYIRNWKKKINSLVTPNAMVITWLINGITNFHGMHFWAIVQGNTVGCNDWINRWCKVRHNWTNVIFRILSVVEFIPYCCWQIKVGLFLCMCINRNW